MIVRKTVTLTNLHAFLRQDGKKSDSLQIKENAAFKIEFANFAKSRTPIHKTRAGALAGVGLALDPEGKKSVLIQPSSFEIKKNT